MANTIIIVSMVIFFTAMLIIAARSVLLGDSTLLNYDRLNEEPLVVELPDLSPNHTDENSNEDVRIWIAERKLTLTPTPDRELATESALPPRPVSVGHFVF